MQDKEIDQLFKSALYDHEVEPTAMVWGNVSTNLNAGKGKKLVTAWLSVAASVLILVVASWFFIPRGKVNDKNATQTAAAKNNKPAKAIIAPEADNDEAIVTQPKASATVASVAIPKRVKQNIRRENVKAVVNAPVPDVQLAMATPRKVDVLTAVVPDAETPLIAKTEVDDDIVFKTNANKTAAVRVPQSSKIMAAAPVKKRRINTLGDLINVVVSKVDKRKDKLIEFTSSDDDDATVTGINLGFLKIKKQD